MLTGDYTNYSAGNLRLFGGFFHDPRSGLADILFVDLRGKLMFYKAPLRPSLWVLPPSKVSYRRSRQLKPFMEHAHAHHGH